MRRKLWVFPVALIAFPSAAWCQQDQQQSQSQQNQSQQTQSASAQSQNQNQSQAAPPQHESLVEAARKAREQRKEAPKPAKVFTNDNIPSEGGISSVGEEKESPAAPASATKGAVPPKSIVPSNGNDEKSWRERFAKLHHKLDQDQAALDVLQRELGVEEKQYYGGDPVKALNDNLNQQPFGDSYTKKLSEIDATKKQVEADKQAIADAEDELRRSGGDSGWAR